MTLVARLAVAAVAALFAAPATDADGGTYSVRACTDADNRNNLFAPFVNRVGEATPAAFGACHVTPSGLRTRTGDRSPDSAAFEFCAPPGATVANLDVSHRTTWKGSGYAVYADSGSCGPYKIANRIAPPASIGVVGDTGWINWEQSAFNGRGVRLLTSCEYVPCPGAGFAETNWRNLEFDIDDPVAPTVSSAPTGWLRGTSQALSISASDNAGVTRMEAGVAGHPSVGWTRDVRPTACDYTRVTPCPTTLNLPATLDTTTLPDGTHDLKITAEDVASNSAPVHSHALRVDNTPPELSLLGAGNPLVAHPRATTVTISARDATSGMGAAADDEPIERGGYVAYRLDSAPEIRTRGDEAEAFIGPGRHRLAYKAVDRAGNATDWLTRDVEVNHLEIPRTGRQPFSDDSLNPRVAFAAAESFAGGCPTAAALQPARDATVLEAGGAPTDLLIRSGVGNRAVSLVGFSMPAAPHCTVKRARLRLFALTGAIARVDVRRAGAAWTEGDLSWSVQPGATGVPASAEASAGNWIEVDVTAHVAALYRLGDNGFELSTPAGELVLASREGEPARRPQLIVEFGS